MIKQKSILRACAFIILVSMITVISVSCKVDNQLTTPKHSDQAGENKANQSEDLSNEDTNTSDASHKSEQEENDTDSKNETDVVKNENVISDDEKDEQDNLVVLPNSERVKAKALYLTGWTVGTEQRLEHFVELANNTEINSYVIDIKDDDGYVGYKSDLEQVQELGTWMNKYDVDHVIAKMHENDIHVIGRLVCFKDPIYSEKIPTLAVKDSGGGLWKEYSNGEYVSWINPYMKESWDYIIDIAREATEKGFDEIQFDYVRFPNGKNMVFGENAQEKNEAINEFLAYVKQQLPNVIISADAFGIICESPADTENIGQYLELIGKDIEYISPMLYPSHYAVGQIVNNVRFEKPDLNPYDVVYNSLAKAADRLSLVSDYKADIRPYLQDFTASWLGSGYYITYGPEQARQQIQAVYDAGFEEWIFWDPSNTYSEEAFNKE